MKGQVVIVTGGTRGIGRAIVKSFVKQGCRVAFTFLSNKKEAASLKRDTKGKAVGYQVDVRDFDKVKEAFRKIKKTFGEIDVLVNNAGVLIDKPFLSMDEADWDTVIDTNLKGTFNATRACIFSFLKRKKGNIINMSSVAGFKGVEGQTNYSSSKAGVIGFTRSLARETGPYGVRVNSITPGFIETDMMSDMDEKIKDKCLSQTPLRRFGSPQDVADLVVFLASEKAGFITGQILTIDGGLTT